MKVTKFQPVHTFTVELTEEELRELRNALDASNVGGGYMVCGSKMPHRVIDGIVRAMRS